MCILAAISFPGPLAFGPLYDELPMMITVVDNLAVFGAVLFCSSAGLKRDMCILTSYTSSSSHGADTTWSRDSPGCMLLTMVSIGCMQTFDSCSVG